MSSKLTRVTFGYEQECSCAQVDLSSLDLVQVTRWRELSTENKVCAILACACPPARKCTGNNCGVTYCLHHGGHHQVTVLHAVAWEPVEAVPLTEAEATKESGPRLARTKRLCKGCNVRGNGPPDPGWSYLYWFGNVGWCCLDCNNNGRWEDHEVEPMEKEKSENDDVAEHDYRATRPAACASGVVCKKCKEEAVKLTFSPDGTSSGVCACPWTSWLWTAAGEACRSEPA